MCKLKSCRLGKPPESPAIVAKPREEVVSKGQVVCTGRNCRSCVAQPPDLPCLWERVEDFHMLAASLERGVCLSSLQKEKEHCGCTGFPHPYSSPRSPSSSSSGERPFMGCSLSPLHQGLPAISSCHTHSQQLFWKIALRLLTSDAQMHGEPGEATTFPGKCLQVLKKK